MFKLKNIILSSLFVLTILISSSEESYYSIISKYPLDTNIQVGSKYDSGQLFKIFKPQSNKDNIVGLCSLNKSSITIGFIKCMGDKRVIDNYLFNPGVCVSKDCQRIVECDEVSQGGVWKHDSGFCGYGPRLFVRRFVVLVADRYLFVKHEVEEFFRENNVTLDQIIDSLKSIVDGYGNETTETTQTTNITTIDGLDTIATTTISTEHNTTTSNSTELSNTTWSTFTSTQQTTTELTSTTFQTSTEQTSTSEASKTTSQTPTPIHPKCNAFSNYPETNHLTKTCSQVDEDYCCGLDRTLDQWIVARGRGLLKPCFGSPECGTTLWVCTEHGYFLTEEPDYKNCQSRRKCSSYDETLQFEYETLPGFFAWGPCPSGSYGYSKWKCDDKGYFVGSSPDMSQCCVGVRPCRDVDDYGFVWTACPGKTATRFLPCPDHEQVYVNATWECTSEGFDEHGPRYELCSCSNPCSVNVGGVNWFACPGKVGIGQCSETETGLAYWTCGEHGEFIGKHPDYSKCVPQWINEVDEAIDDQGDSQDILTKIEEKTRLGVNAIEEVTNVVERCVDLFIKQSVAAGDLVKFDSFSEKYALTLANIVTNTSVWSSIVFQEDKLLSTKKILDTTEKLAFSLATIFEGRSVNYSKTFPEVVERGLGLLILYSKTPNNSNQELESDSVDGSVAWTASQSNDEETFVSYNLVFNQTFGQYMFPAWNTTDHHILNAPIITLTVGRYKDNDNITIIQDGLDVKFNFKHNVDVRTPTSQVIQRQLYEGETRSAVLGSARCVYWDNSIGNWSSNGCVKVFDSKSDVNCACDHLSSFSVVMDLHQYVPDKALQTVSFVCSILTLVSLVLTVIVLADKSLLNEKNIITIHLCCSLFCGHLMILLFLDKTHFLTPDVLCSVLGGLIHYAFLTSFSWMLVQGHYLYRSFLLVFNSPINFKWIYIGTGYGGPVVIVALTLIVGFSLGDNPYGNDEICWLAVPKYVWFFIVPTTCVVIINLIMLGLTMRIAIKKKLETQRTMDQSK